MHLLVRLTRVSPTRHLLAIERADGTREAHDLETRSTLFHDLVHFALETEARLTQSFWGRLAHGTPYVEMTMSGATATAEALATERIVGALQGALRKGIEPAAFVAAFTGYLRSMDELPPPWLTAELVARVQERVRRLEGHWRGTPFGEAMELRFELGE